MSGYTCQNLLLTRRGSELSRVAATAALTHDTMIIILIL